MFIRTIMMRRTFSRKATRSIISKRPETPNTPLAGIRGKIEVTENQEDAETFDPDDISEFETDFMNVNKSHRIHEWEMRQKKERLKQQITVQKYFKEKQPRFLTFAETDLIRKLHDTNPEEWTIERLSESFPALPQTIQKILHAKWLPKSVERVIQYDHMVVENWRKFHTGQLAVDPILGKHLAKFKNRKIILTDRESLAKQFVEPKPEFQKPKSQLFSSIIQSYLNEKQSTEKLLSQENASNKELAAPQHSNQSHNSSNSNNIKSDANVTAIKDSGKFTSSRKESFPSQVDSAKYDLMQSNKEKNINTDEALTFTEFVKAKLKNIYEECPEEGMTLLDVYRKQMEAVESDNTTINMKETNVSVQKMDKSNCAVSEYENRAPDIISTKDYTLDTYVKARNKKVDVELEYARPIKIAKHLHKPNMTYRVGDCYYDNDGEFLYRVPGVRS